MWPLSVFGCLDAVSLFCSSDREAGKRGQTPEAAVFGTSGFLRSSLFLNHMFLRNTWVLPQYISPVVTGATFQIESGSIRILAGFCSKNASPRNRDTIHMGHCTYTPWFLLSSPNAEQASPIQSRVTFSLDLFILVCASVRFWHYGKASLKSCKGLSHSSRSWWYIFSKGTHPTVIINTYPSLVHSSFGTLHIVPSRNFSFKRSWVQQQHLSQLVDMVLNVNLHQCSFLTRTRTPQCTLRRGGWRSIAPNKN